MKKLILTVAISFALLSITKAQVGLWPYDPFQYTFFGSLQLNQNIPGNYALLQSNSVFGPLAGATFLNSPTQISFKINNNILAGTITGSQINFVLPTIFSSTLSVAGPFSVTGPATFSNTIIGGTLGVKGATTFSSTLGVTGNSIFSNNVTIGGILGVKGATTFSSTVGIIGNTSIGGILGVTGPSTFASTLGVTGNSIFSNNVTIGGILSVKGATTFSSTVGITGNTSIGGMLGVTGPSTFASTLGVTGSTNLNNATVGGTLGVTGAANLASTLGVIGNTSLNNTTIGGTLGVTGNSNLSNTTIGGTLGVTGNVGIGTSTPSELLEVNGNIKADDSLIANYLSVAHGFQSQTIVVNTITTDSIHATKSMQIGNSIVLSSDSIQSDTTGQGNKNNIYTDNGPLYLQSTTNDNFNTIINANGGSVGIGSIPSTGNKLEIAGGNLQVDSASITINGDSRNPANNWTNANWRTAMSFPNASVIRTNTTGRFLTNQYLGFGMDDDDMAAGWFWIVSSKTDTTECANYPMKLLLNPGGIQGPVSGQGQAELIIEQFTWCDYVFADNYKRMGFEEQLNFFKTEKHLRGLPSEKEIADKGLSINGTLKGLTQNVEEAKLDMIDLYKLIDQQKTAIEALQKEVNTLKKQVK